MVCNDGFGVQLIPKMHYYSDAICLRIKWIKCDGVKLDSSGFQRETSNLSKFKGGQTKKIICPAGCTVQAPSKLPKHPASAESPLGDFQIPVPYVVVNHTGASLEGLKGPTCHKQEVRQLPLVNTFERWGYSWSLVQRRIPFRSVFILYGCASHLFFYITY